MLSRRAVRRAAVRRPARLQFEALEQRSLLTAPNLFFPNPAVFPAEELRQPPIIRSQGGTLEANLNMVRATLADDPNPFGIAYGGQRVFSTPADPGTPSGNPNPIYAMAYQVDAYGESYAAMAPGPIFQLNRGETLNFHVEDNLAPPGTAAGVTFNTNLHTHGFHVSPLNDGDNVYREIVPGQGMDVSIFIPEAQPSGMNWYHVHRHGSTHEQVYGGLAGFIMVGDPLDPWPELKESVTQLNMGIAEVNIQPIPGTEDGQILNYVANVSGANFSTGWQKRVNGQVNPTIRVRPGETQVWNMGSIGAFGGFNLAITDADLANPWSATLLVQDGNGQFIRPYELSLAADSARMQDLAAATLVMPGNRLSLAVTAPTTPGTYYLIDGWGGQDKPALVGGQQAFYVLATIIVEGDPVSFAPEFGPVGPIDPLFLATPDVQRTYEFKVVAGATPADNVFLINGEVFGEGVMPQMQIGTVEEWLLTNPKQSGPGAANANHPFHIHQGDFVVVEVNGVAVDPTAAPPPEASSLAYVTGRDVINIPTGQSIKIRFRVEDFPGKYVFHCHILKHEDQGMMSPVLAFGPAAGLRLGFGSASGPARVNVLDGTGALLGTIRPFPRSYTGEVVTASGLGESDDFQTMVVGAASGFSTVRVYEDGELEPRTTFRAFTGRRGRNGVSLAVGGLNASGASMIAVGSRAPGAAVVRLFDLDGRLVREFANVLPGRLSSGVNVASGDINGDNFDDLIIAAARGSDPLVTVLDGRDIAMGMAEPATLVTFRPGGGAFSGTRVAVGYVAPGTVPSYLANIITTPEVGPLAGVVEVWNPADLGVSGGHASAAAHGHSDSMTADEAPMPLVRYRPFGAQRRPVQIASNYQGKPGVPVIAAWLANGRIAFSTITPEDQVITRPWTVRRHREAVSGSRVKDQDRV